MPRLMRSLAPRARRRGMTLVEIMIALVLLGIISGVIMRVILRQQRFYQGANQIMTQRAQLRQATSVLPVDLRSLSSIGADILAATDASIEFRMNVGTGIVCEIVDKTKVALPPVNLFDPFGGKTLTSFFGYGAPVKGTEVFIYNDSMTVGNEEDRWQPLTLEAVHEDASRCLGPEFVSIADAGKKRPILEVSSSETPDPVGGGPLSQYIRVGAPVRLMRRARYELYKESDGKWYLGFASYDPTTSTYETLSPVSGPYDPYASGSGTATGLGFRYYDVDGIEIASGADELTRRRIARVDLIARARTATEVRSAGIQAGVSQQYKDSLAVTVMLRNRQ